MRYNVHPPRAFRNRIAKSIGVLVAAALIATLGLPSAAQAQTIPNSPMGIAYDDDDGFTVTGTTRLADVNNWIVTFTKPNGDKVVVDQHTTDPDGALRLMTLASRTPISFRYNRNDAGTWWFQVDACFSDWGDGAVVKEVTDSPEAVAAAKLTACPKNDRQNGTAVGYTHGPFPPRRTSPPPSFQRGSPSPGIREE